MDWLRLWHDMPNDPKWRTIARQSKQSVALVQALYLHLLVAASTNVTRGNAEVTTEDLASALDATDEEIDSVLKAMQGRVLEGRSVTGWEKRQPKRHDDSGERVRKYREKSKAKEESNKANCNADEANESQCNAAVTQRNAPEEIRGEESKETTPSSGDDAANQKPAPVHKTPEPEYQAITDIYNEVLGEFLPEVVKINKKRKSMISARWKEVFGKDSRGNDLGFWRRYFLHVSRSKSLTGTKDGFNWRPGFDWLLNESNMTRVIEGEFHQGDDRRVDYLREAS
jgi:hypothetical protein